MNHFEIIIPVYKCQKYLDKCIESIELQDYPKELINITIIDDKSEPKLNIIKTSFNVDLIQNNKRMYAGYNRYLKYSKCNDNDIIIFLDGDDWFVDNKCLGIIDNVYRNNKIHWSISNHKIYKDNKVKVMPSFINLPLELDKPKICHLRCGYGYVWNNMTENYLDVDKSYIRWMSDWNENLYAIKNYGQPFKIDCSLVVYNLDTMKTKKENNNYNEMIVWFQNKYL